MQIILTFKFTSSPFFTDRAALQEFSVKPFFCIPSAEFLFRHGVVFFSKLSFRAVRDQALTRYSMVLSQAIRRPVPRLAHTQIILRSHNSGLFPAHRFCNSLRYSSDGATEEGSLF